MALGQDLTHLVNLKSRTRALRWVGRHPELMGDEADGILERHVRDAQRAGDARRQELLQRSLQLVRVCRHNGVEAVLAGLTKPLAENDLAKLARLLAEHDPNPRDLQTCREIVALLPSDRTDVTLASLEGAMRMTVAALTIDGADFELELAVDAFEEALELETRRTSRASLQRALGDALLARRHGDRAVGVRNLWLALELPDGCSAARLAVRAEADVRTKRFGIIPAGSETARRERPSVVIGA